jgi:hypothetical protein
MPARSLSRVIAALAVLALAAGTALAAGPSLTASPSATASAGGSGGIASNGPSATGSEPLASPSASPSPAFSPSVTTEPTNGPKGNEKPEPAESPEAAEAPESPPSAAEVADIVGKLKAAGITTTPAAFQSLAGKVGVGGAVRTLAFAHASGKTPDQILAMFQAGKGWGKIRHELGLSINPGIGWIMGDGH